MIVSLLLYTLCWFVTYVIARLQYKKALVNMHGVQEVNTKKLSILAILFIALLCTLYNVYVTETSVSMGGDRTNYLYDYEYFREVDSIGEMALLAFARSQDWSFDFILYFSTFVTVVLALLGYRHSKDARPFALLLFFLTPFVMNTFTSIKQTYSIGCATLMIMLLLQHNSFLKDIICIGLVVISCLFHPSSYILILVYILLRLDISINKPIPLLIVIAALFFGFKPILLFLAKNIGALVPFLSNTILDYFGETASGEESGFLVTLKGLPFYYITFISIRYKTILKSKIEYYDKYFILSVLLSACYLVSYFNVWMARFADYFTFAVLVFWAMIIKLIPKSQMHRVFVSSLIVFFTYRLLILIYLNYGGF